MSNERSEATATLRGMIDSDARDSGEDTPAHVDTTRCPSPHGRPVITARDLGEMAARMSNPLRSLNP